MILAFLAVLSIFTMLASVAAIFTLKQWQIGLTESIAAILAMGLCIDFVVHFLADYVNSPHRHRKHKVK